MRALALILALLAAGCVQLTRRAGPSLPLDDTPAANACERERWLELAPASTQSHEAAFEHGEATYREARGVALLDRDHEAQELRVVVPAMGEPRLAIPLQTFVEPVDRGAREALYWVLGGIGAMAAGVGYGATGGNEPRADHIAAMSAGLALGLAGAIMSIVRMPRKSARMEADLRRTMFVEGEYELDALKRGTLRLHQQQRDRCATTPATR